MSPSKPLRFLFLYTRLPDYFYRCIEHLLGNSPGQYSALVVRYPGDIDAPYGFGDVGGNIRILHKSSKIAEEIDTYSPDVAYVAGWGDREYNLIARKLRPYIPVIVGLDNPWKGTIRQRLASLVASFLVRRLASHFWVTGAPQYEFARRLGIPSNRILKGLYCADTRKFQSPQLKNAKQIVYVGRLVGYKRPDWLLETFCKLIETNPHLHEWELTIVGNGPMREALESQYGTHDKITFTPFLQPDDVVPYFHRASIFCMPSHQEHWGVVVQEAAAAGLALLLSDTCGAASEFLINGHNGFIFRSADKEHFANCLLQLMNMPEDEMIRMRKASEILSERITPDYWVANLKSVLNGH